MRKILTLLAIAACGDDSGMSVNETGAPPGVLPNSGWKEVYAYKTSGIRGIDFVRHIAPASMHADGEDVLLLYNEETLGQQGMIGGRLLFRFANAAGKPIASEPGLSTPRNQIQETHQVLWVGAEPRIFSINNQAPGITQKVAEFIKGPVGDAYLPPEDSSAPAPLPGGLGGAAIAPDGKHYIFGRTPFLFDRSPPAADQWKSMFCYPRAGDPTLGFSDGIVEVDASDPQRFLQLALAGGEVRLWRHDPTLPPADAASGYPVGTPGCGPMARAAIPEARTASRHIVGGVEKIVARSETKIWVLTYANNTLTLDAETTVTALTPISVATDGTSLWFAYLDSAHENRVTVLVNNGATIEPVGMPGFSTVPAGDLSDIPTLRPFAAAVGGRVLVAYSRAPYIELEGGYASMWIVTPE